MSRCFVNLAPRHTLTYITLLKVCENAPSPFKKGQSLFNLLFASVAGRDNFDADSLTLQESHTYSYILVVYAYG